MVVGGDCDGDEALVLKVKANLEVGLV